MIIIINYLYRFLPNAGRRDAHDNRQQNFVVQDMIDDVSSGDTCPNKAICAVKRMDF